MSRPLPLVRQCPVAPGGGTSSLRELYSPAHLAELAVTVAVGTGLYFLATRSRPGERLLARLRRRRSGVSMALALLLAGFVALTLLTWRL